MAEDHSQYIKGTFKKPQDVTKQCLTCHEESAKQVMQTSHWTWSTPPVKVPGHEGLHQIGKKDIFNNYCINVQSNWPRCTSCHTGYGWQDKSFDFQNEENVDCLICHADPKIYKKIQPEPVILKMMWTFWLQLGVCACQIGAIADHVIFMEVVEKM